MPYVLARGAMQTRITFVRIGMQSAGDAHQQVSGKHGSSGRAERAEPVAAARKGHPYSFESATRRSTVYSSDSL
jgi:hypothetical protein